MTMSHAGYILYICMVIALYGSPLIALALFLGWRRKGFLKTLVAILVLIPVAASVAYLLVRYA